MEPDRARLRNEILAGENDINTLSGFLLTGRLQFPQRALPPHHPVYPNTQYPNAQYPNAGPGRSGGYSNHDLLTPVNAPGGYVRQGRALLLSASGRSMRFFKRREGVPFDDETGEDFNDVSAEMTFSDIAHIRGNQRYNTSQTQVLDTLPIIPVVGPSLSTKNLNNIQYRKYMNHQKKKNLANGARAMSLAGNNPTADTRAMSFGGNPDNRAMSFGPDNRAMSFGPDNRAMSFGPDNRAMSFGPGNRAMSLGMPGAPRTMSLNSNMMLGNGPGGRRPGYIPPQYYGMQGQVPNGPPGNAEGMVPNGPAGNMQHQYQYQNQQGNGQNMPYNNPNMMYMQRVPGQPGQPGQQGPYARAGPRAQSLMTGNPYDARGPVGPPGVAPVYSGPRAQSLTQGNAYPLRPPQGQLPFQRQPPNGQLQSGQVPPQLQGRQVPQQLQTGQDLSDMYQNGQQYQPQNGQLQSELHQSGQPQKISMDPEPPRIPQQTSHTNSTESLMEVVEEYDEDANATKDSLPLAVMEEEEDDSDHIYQFENDIASPLVSRKSTIKKANSMRVRRLDLFKNQSPDNSLHEDRASMDTVGSRLCRKLIVELSDDETKKHRASQADKFKVLGASASSEKDVFVTASEFRSPNKKQTLSALSSPIKERKLTRKAPEPFQDDNLENTEGTQKHVDTIAEDEKDLTQTTTHLADDKTLQTIDSKKTEANLADNSFSKDMNKDAGASSIPIVHTDRISSGESLDSTKRLIQLKNLAANTAFSSFRTPSLSSPQATLGSKIPEYEPPIDKNFSETESSSIYSDDTRKQLVNSNVLVSASSEQPSSALETSLKKMSLSDVTCDQVDLVKKISEPMTAIHNLEQYHDNSGRDADDLNNVDSEGPVSHTQFNTNTSDTHVENEVQKKTETECNSVRVDDEKAHEFHKRNSLLSMAHKDITPLIQKRTSVISRSNSELKMQGLLPVSGLIRGSDTSDFSSSPEKNVIDDKKEKRKSRTSSISSKSMNFIKRMSRSGSKKNIAEDWDQDDTMPSSAANLRAASGSQVKRPLVLTKEELAIMTCNNDLQNELQMVTNELALSIKRELALELQLRNDPVSFNADDNRTLEHQIVEKSKQIAELLEKLNNERRLRFISEEHVLLNEHGQNPSPLKLDYEKNEIYKQLLAKNDMVNQLQDRLDELEYSNAPEGHETLLHKYNDLLRENSELRSKLNTSQRTWSDNNGIIHHDDQSEHDQAEIISLRTQRDELREMLTKLTSSENVKLKIAHERINTLEDKLQKVNMINDKLSKRLGQGERDMFAASGGKLLGFDIVSPTKRLFDNSRT